MSSAYQYGVETTRAARGEREGQRAGGDLLAVAVRRHEDVGRGEQVGSSSIDEEAVVELDVVVEPEVDNAPLEHAAGIARPRRRATCGMGAPGDHV